jgi:4-amino-4-deoxy-L-arabinose transferase-like glycosyltransferase
MTGDKIQEYAIAIITVVVSTFFWVFSVVAVYAIFMRQYERPGAPDYWRVLAYVGAGLALLFPGFGYVIIFLAFAIPAFTSEYIAK